MFGEGGWLTGTATSTATGAAAGSIMPGWGTMLGAGIGLATGVVKYLGGFAQAKAMRREAAEALRRKKLHDAQVFGQATAAGAASGIDMESASLTAYLDSMKAEMKRQQDWMSRAATRNARNLQTAAGWNLVTDIGRTGFEFAAQNNWFQEDEKGA